MTSIIKKTTLAIAFCAIVLCAGTAQAQMTREQVDKAIEEYILAHPEMILKSVDDYQRRAMQEKSADAVKKNKDDLFADKNAPFIGNEKGDITIVEFFDYNCGYCKKAFPELSGLIAEDKNLKIIFKELPILGPTSEKAAKWALAAHKQGKYFPFHQKMMEHQGPINDEVLEKAATAAGLDLAKAKADQESTDVLIGIEKNRSLAGSMGISGTPAFVIGDEIIPGAIGKEALKERIDAARKAKGAAEKKQ